MLQDLTVLMGLFIIDVGTLLELMFAKRFKSYSELGVIHKYLNSNLVVLLPKERGACSVSLIRPIALSNFLFKIIPKIIATRLSTIIDKLVLPSQCGFVKGRQIFSCVTAISYA